jgi:hypothetical protein
MLGVVVALWIAGVAWSEAALTTHVSTNSLSDGPGTAWSNAFWTIQGAVDAASCDDTVVVTNGTYLLSSEIVVSNAITVTSVNGCDVTIVDAQGTHRCFNLSNSACALSGCTIRNGNAGSATSLLDTNTDDDPHTDYEAFIADTDGTNSNDYVCVTAVSNNSPVTLYFESSSNRTYSLISRSLLTTGDWSVVTGRTGTGGSDSLSDANLPAKETFYPAESRLGC